MKYILATCLLFALFSLSAQERGVTPVSSPGGSQEGATYAVVVGISDYQDEKIPDLRFAHKDAEAFAQFLQSPAGGSLPAEHIKLLTNEKATTAQVAAALEWLVEVSGEGDQAIIYYSGHGDVETKTMFQLGYLLTWDAPARTYVAGAFPLSYLQAIVSTLSLQQKAKVVLITDACRAGKLAGTEIGGAQLTNANLSKQFANEVKILSCQPDEFSIEGEQWGGGRGAFSYHLIDGLYGLADNNNDGRVNLFEIGRYLEDRVSSEAAPHNQFPMTVGGKLTQLAKVDEATLAALVKERSGQEPVLASIESKGLEEAILADADSIWQNKYRQFVAAVEAGHLLEAPEGAPVAYDLYLELTEVAELERLHGTIKRNLAAALQDDAQQAVNAYLAANPAELEKRYNAEQDYGRYPRYLEKAAEILGEQNFYYPYVMAKLYYFRGLRMRIEAENGAKGVSYQEAIELQEKALQYQAYAPYVLNELGVLYTRIKEDKQAAEYLKRAIELAPEWGLPYANYSVGLFYTGQYEQSIHYGEKALQYLPDFPQMYNFLAWIYANESDWRDKQQWERKGLELSGEIRFNENSVHSIEQLKIRYQKAIELLEKARQIDSANYQTSLNLGVIYRQIKEMKKAESALINATRLDSTQSESFFYLGRLYLGWGRTKEGKKALLKFIELSPSERDKSDGYNSLQWAFMQEADTITAIQLLHKAIALYPRNPFPYINLGSLYLQMGDFEKGEHIMLKGLVARGDDFPLTYTFLVKLYGQMNRSVEVDYFSKKGLEIKPDNVKLMKELVKYYGENGQFDKALEWQKKLMEITPDDSYSIMEAGKTYYLAGQPEQAESYFRKAVELAPNRYTPNEIASFYIQHSEFDLAEKYLNTARPLDPSYFGTLGNLTDFYILIGEPEKALEILDAAIAEQNPPRLKGFLVYQKSRVYFHRGEMDKCIQFAKEAESIEPAYRGMGFLAEKMKEKDWPTINAILTQLVESFPTDPDSRLYHSEVLLQLGDTPAAHDAFVDAVEKGIAYEQIRSSPAYEKIRQFPVYEATMRQYFPEKYDDSDTFEFEQEAPVYYLENCVLLAKFYDKQGEIERARFLYKKAIELRTDSLSAIEQVALAEAYLKLGDYEKAKEVCPEEVEVEEEEVLLELGRLLYLLGKKEKAIAHFEKYISVAKNAPRYGEPTADVGHFFKDHGAFELSELYFKKAMERQPEKMIIRRSLARLYFFSDKKEKAYQVLQEAIRLQPNDLSTHGVYCLLSYYDNPEEAKPRFEKSGFTALWECLELMRNNQFEEADQAWQKRQNNNTAWWMEFAKYKYLQMKIRQGEQEEALSILKEILAKGTFVNYQLLKTDNELNPIRESNEFVEIMQKYFPEKVKN